MPEATVQARVSYGMDDPAHFIGALVTLTNTSDKLAFFIEMRLVDKKSQQTITPIFWDDNYISLPPHTTKTFRVHFSAGSGTPELKLQGWNVKFRDVIYNHFLGAVQNLQSIANGQ